MASGRKEGRLVSKLRPHFSLRTPAQQDAWRAHLERRLATYHRPEIDNGFGSPEREIGAFRREYEHMPLVEFFGGLWRIEGHYHVPKVTEGGYYKTPMLLERDVATAAGIWRSVRNEWVAAWLAEAREVFGLAELPPATMMHTDVVPGIPWHAASGERGLWLAAPWEWPVPEAWTRETSGVFEVYEDDLEELRRLPHNLDGVGSCEPEEFAVMNLPDLAALSRIILALFDLYGPDGLLTHSREVEKDEWQEEEEGLQFGLTVPVFYTKIAFDCRPWLKPEFMEGGPDNG